MKSPSEYIESKLKDGERVVYKTGIHPVIMGAPLLLVIIAGLSIPGKGMSAVIFLLIAVVFTVVAAISFRNSELAVTGMRLLGKLGFPIVRPYDIDLTKIVNVHVTQPALGKFLNFGRVMVRSVDGTGGSFRMISNPLGLVQQMQEQVDIIKARIEAEAGKA
jgi:hypothetical protein